MLSKQLSQYLNDFGLTDTEISLYFTLLKSGPFTIMDLSRASGIKRSTTHNNVEELIKKGLITQTTYGERRMVVAEDPEKLRFILEQKKWGIKKLEDGLGEILSFIHSSIEKKSNVKPVIRYYEGKKGFREVSQRSLDLAKKEILFISNLDEWHKVYTQEYDEKYYIPTRLKRKIKLKLLAKKSNNNKVLYYNNKKLLREIKYFTEKEKFKSTILIYDGEVSIMISSEPYSAIVISSDELFSTFRALFISIWNKYE